MKVLLVEDNPINVMVVKSMLEYADMDVVVRENGQEAIDMLRKKDFSFILMDLSLPVMNGFEAVKEIRNDTILGKKRNIPIIAFTAFLEKDPAVLLEYGFDDYLAKPVDLLTLLRTILSVFLKCNQTLTEKNQTAVLKIGGIIESIA